MSSIKIPAVSRISNIANTASNLQQAIIGMANFDEILHNELEKQRKEQENKKEDKREEFEFNPDDIETLVYRSRNKFKDELTAKVEQNVVHKEIHDKNTTEQKDIEK